MGVGPTEYDGFRLTTVRRCSVRPFSTANLYQLRGGGHAQARAHARRDLKREEDGRRRHDTLPVMCPLTGQPEPCRRMNSRVI